MWNGLRRLLLLNIPSPIKYLHEKLPNKAKLGLYFNPYGKVLELIDDCISCGVDQLIDANGGPVWTEEGFAALHEKVRAELNDGGGYCEAGRANPYGSVQYQQTSERAGGYDHGAGAF